MSETLITQENNPGTLSLLDLPLDLIRLLIIESRNPTVFRVCKLFTGYAKDDEFWKTYSKHVTNNSFPPQHFSTDMRFHANRSRPYSWKSYAMARIEYDKTLVQPANEANRKRILVITITISSNPF